MARVLAPEDIRPRDFVAVAQVIDQRLSGCLFEPGPVEVRTFLRLPGEEPEPLRVVSVCIPFVLVRTAQGDARTLDVRRMHLMRLSPKFGRAAFKLLKERKAEPAATLDPD